MILRAKLWNYLLISGLALDSINTIFGRMSVSLYVNSNSTGHVQISPSRKVCLYVSGFDSARMESLVGVQVTSFYQVGCRINCLPSL